MFSFLSNKLSCQAVATGFVQLYRVFEGRSWLLPTLPRPLRLTRYSERFEYRNDLDSTQIDQTNSRQQLHFKSEELVFLLGFRIKHCKRVCHYFESISWACPCLIYFYFQEVICTASMDKWLALDTSERISQKSSASCTS